MSDWTSARRIGLATDVRVGGMARAISLWLYTDDRDATVERLRADGTTGTEELTTNRGVSAWRECSIRMAIR